MKILLSTLAAASMSAAVASWTAPAPAYDYIVRIDKGFDPDPIEVKIGDTVMWKNFDSDAHTVTGEVLPALPRDSGFDSGVILSGGSYEVTFPKIGTYRYYCRLHPERTGTVVVTR